MSFNFLVLLKCKIIRQIRYFKEFVNYELELRSLIINRESVFRLDNLVMVLLVRVILNISNMTFYILLTFLFLSKLQKTAKNICIWPLFLLNRSKPQSLCITRMCVQFNGTRYLGQCIPRLQRMYLCVWTNRYDN